ncbi:MAG: ABC-type transport system involved in Fe-S cluster assembly fused permease/ATPase subunit [Hyphomicrobiaceae bacterium]|jgi:ABC-type transport system involved in Fe-S cluster assembly fused permease/ATPase subunit
MHARVVVAMACLAAAKFANVYVPILYKHAIDALDGHTALVLPMGLIFAYGAARVGSLAFAELRDAVFAKVGQRAIRNIALSVFRHLHELSLRFHLDRQTGGLSRSIERGTKAISTLLSFMLFSILPTILEMILVFIILWTLLDMWFALVTITTVVAYIAYTLFVTEWRLEFRRRMNEQDNRANTRAIDSLLNYETVKYFSNEEHEARRFDEALEDYEKAGVASQVSLSVLNIGQAAIISTGMTAVMYMAGSGIVAGEMTIGDFVLANTYLLQLYQPLGFFGFVYREIKQSLIDMEKLFDLLTISHEVADVPDALPLDVGGAELRFENVHFAYDSRREILKGVSFTVPAGKTVAIVGPSGAGKSTIARLLFRFYDVNSGRILIDGQDIKKVTQTSLRKAIGIVPQDTVLFNDTIEYNLLYGRPSASGADARRAAELAHVAEAIGRMPDGYETVVGERGLKLSGGEKQRVAIARTVLKDPKLLILDEATSALDSRTEQSIQANLRELSVGRTTVTIAHRLSTVIDADEILVVDGGLIVERGTHSALLAAGAEYAGMWRRQQEHNAGDASLVTATAPS